MSSKVENPPVKRNILLNPCIAGLQRNTFAMIHIVMKNDASFFFQPGKNTLKLFTGPVINDHPMNKTGLFKLSRIWNQTVIWFQGRDQNDRMEQLIISHGKPPYLEINNLF